MAARPETIGRYRVDNTLGTGAMGVVYAGHDPDIDRRVAIKLVRGDLLEGVHGEAYLGRFRQEVQAAGRCHHPNIVAIFDFGMHDDSPYFVMEYVDGVGLDRDRRGLGVGPQAGGALVLQLLDALAYAHGLGVVHRDIKPANLLITPEGQVKVMDFGISRISTSRLTQTGSVMGTPGYMSPEQLRGDAVDLRTDIFATGAVLYEVLKGEPPIAGRSFEEVMAKVLWDEPVVLPPACERAPPAMRAIVEKALAKNPADRFQSAGQMAAAVRLAMAQEATSDTPATVFVAPQVASAAPRVDNVGDDPRLAELEGALTLHLGPIAGRLVKRYARGADTYDALCQKLSEELADPKERTAFLRRVAPRSLSGTRPPVPGRPATAAPAGADSGVADRAPTPEDLAAIEQALVRHVGPIAGLLVRRAAAKALGLRQLREALAEHIDQPRERAASLAGG